MVLQGNKVWDQADKQQDHNSLPSTTSYGKPEGKEKGSKETSKRYAAVYKHGRDRNHGESPEKS